MHTVTPHQALNWVLYVHPIPFNLGNTITIMRTVWKGLAAFLFHDLILLPQQPHRVHTVIIPILQTRRLRLSRVKDLPKG